MASSIPYQHIGNDGGCFQIMCSQSGDGGGASASSIMPLGTKFHADSHHHKSWEMKSTEDFLASEMNKLSVQERSKALDDLHCVGEELKETPELIEQSLAEFDRILKEKNAPIYEIAARQNRAYVEDPNFRLRFLRAKLHDAEKAANQMIAFLSRKETYFGRDKIARDITLEDLNEEDMDLLSKGVYHIQDGTDRNGRMVLYVLNHALSDKSKPETMIRLNYFILFNILGQLETVQAKGIAVCYYDLSTADKPCCPPSLDAMIKFTDFVTKVPVRRSALHLCLKVIPGSLMSNNVILGSVLRRLRQQTRARARVHYGSDIELQYKLRSHGFFPETIPVNIGGNIRRDILNVWFQKYVSNEWYGMFSSASQMPLPEAPSVMIQQNGGETYNSLDYNAIDGEGLIEPTPKDVLLGRGRGSQFHPGNVRFREFLNDYQEEYNNTPRYKRVDTPKELTRYFLENGVRFLQKTESGDGWVEANFSEAEKKVKQLFRTRKKMMKKASEKL